MILETLLADLAQAVVNAVAAGATHDAIMQSVKEAMVAASDAEMHRELDPTDKP